MASITKLCSVKGCEQLSIARGYCNAHYLKYQRYGDPLAGISYQRSYGEPCSVEECSEPVHAKGVCNLHYRRMLTYGDPNLGKPSRTHGMFGTPTYTSWCSMKERCYRPTHPSYKYYGARGIKVCERWLNSFENFLEDMGARPSLDHTLDRKDVNGNYEPGNCKWSTLVEQNGNRRFRPNASGYIGVYSKRRRNSKYYMRINFDGRRYELGSFADALDAAYVYDQFALALRRDTTQLNVLGPNRGDEL